MGKSDPWRPQGGMGGDTPKTEFLQTGVLNPIPKWEKELTGIWFNLIHNISGLGGRRLHQPSFPCFNTEDTQPRELPVSATRKWRWSRLRQRWGGWWGWWGRWGRGGARRRCKDHARQQREPLAAFVEVPRTWMFRALWDILAQQRSDFWTFFS